ncbi:hypothetical protein M514_01207 [Trichuris suis]|uniref:LMBR1-like conserved region n=1 Tax=Trichuris suis TaxID=68888 RepID=A0A085NMZ6_9BILA|nr:hypothetical protein M514_01207 [Trichuris suis]
MGVTSLVLELLIVFVIVLMVLHQYGDWKRQHVVVSLSTIVAWYFAFVIVFLLPLDVVLTFHRLCVIHYNSTLNKTHQANPCHPPSSYMFGSALPVLWRVVYWTSQLLTWIVLPMMQSYSNAGEFTPVGKLKRALINNAAYYGTYLIVFTFLLIYATISGHIPSGENLKTICIAASNTWGMFWLVLLLGYGLVEVPRNVWLSSLDGFSLRKAYFRLGKLSIEKNDAEEAVKEAYRDTTAAHAALRNCPERGPLVKVILQKFPETIVTKLMKASDFEVTGGDYAAADVKSLANLHKRSIRSLQDYNRSVAQWDALMASALRREDIFESEKNPQRELVMSSVVVDRSFSALLCSPRIRWYWECKLRRYVLRAIAIFMCIMTGFIVWSESTFFSIHPPLSLAALFVHLAAVNQDYVFIEVFSIITIMYLCLCAYYTVFRLKVYRYYHLDSHHHTDENSLLFSAILFCRLTPPMCLNFLGLIHMDAHVTKDLMLETETAYTAIMGHLDVIEAIAGSFNIYFPMAIILLCMCTYFRLGTRLLHFIGFEQFMENDDITADFVVSGKALVLAERNQAQRELNRESRDQFWRNKLADRYSGSKQESNADRESAPDQSRISYNDRRSILDQEETVRRNIFDSNDRWRQSYGTPQSPPAAGQGLDCIKTFQLLFALPLCIVDKWQFKQSIEPLNPM